MGIFVASWEAILAFVGIATAIVTSVFAFRHGVNGYRLLRRMNAGKARGSRRKVLKTLFYIGIRNFRSLLLREERFLRHVRIRVEHEVFDPAPIWQWPLADDDENYGKPDFSLDFRDKTKAQIDKIRAKARAAAKLAFAEDLLDWRHRMAKLNVSDSDTPPEVTLKLAGTLNDNLSDIKRYFDTLKTLGIDTIELKFVCAVSVKSGFIASQHLLSGLLVRFNEKWDHIIRGFESASEGEGLHLQELPRDLRQVQSFIYYCWLLWGPSIPICGHKCDAWNADFAALQFGYGDENNSIDLVGEHDWLREQFGKLLADNPANNAMAVPASVWGELQYSSIADHSSDAIPQALRHSWRGGQDERPILFMSRATKGEKLDGRKYDRPGGIGPAVPAYRQLQSRYYSSYLWVMFVLLRREGRGKRALWVPVNADEKASGFRQASSSPWMTAIPFFEHGNLADRETCRFSKEQLAEKALGGLTRMAAMIPAGSAQYKFAYVCAIDDANCSIGLAFEELVGGKTVAKIMKDRMAGAPGRYAAASIDFDHYRPEPPDDCNPHSACSQTEWVGKHYLALETLRT